MIAKKIGRNDPCPCGSGKKYKQCCQQKSLGQGRTTAAGLSASVIPQALRAALQYHQAGYLAQAEAIYHQILQAMPNHPDALHLLGALALHDGDVELAIKLTLRAIKANPSNPEAYCNLGLALHEQGQLQIAEENYRKALTIKPDYANAWYNLHALLISQDIKPAIDCLEQVTRHHPNDMDARLTLGVLQEYADNAEAAVHHFNVVEASGANVFKARLEAYRYLKSASVKRLPLTGSNIQTFEHCMAAATVEGMVLEFGVRHGNTIRQIAGLVNQQVHGFDSFEGLPEVWHHEPKGSYTTKGVIPSVPHNVTLHVGWFENTLPKFLEQHEGPVRFINIDCDIYSSTKTVLDQLAPRIVPGTVIVFDEYIGNEHWREDEFKAFQEAVTRYGWTYQYLCFSLFTKQVAVCIKETASG